MSCTSSTTKSSTIIATSNVQTYDGSALGIVSLPGSPSLNDAIEAIDAAIQTVNNSVANDTSEITYNGSLTLSCITLTAGDLNSILSQLATAICNNSTAITGLNSSDINYDGSLGGSNINIVLEGLDSDITAVEEGLVTKPSAEDTEGSFNAIADNGFIKDDGSGAVTDAGGLTIDVSAGSGGKTEGVGSDGKFISRDPETAFPLDATKDNYIDISSTDLKNTSVTIGNPAPSLGTGYVRLAKVETDATSVVSVTDLRDTAYVDTNQLFDDTVTTTKIADLNVTGSKLEDVVTGATQGDADFLTVTYDNKGRVTAGDSKINIGTLQDGDVLQWDNAAGDWKNQQLDQSSVILSKKLTLSSAQILALNTSPVELVSAPGAGKYVEILTLTYRYNWGTAAYVTNDDLHVRANGASDSQFQQSNFFAKTANAFSSINRNAGTTTTVYVEDAAIELIEPSGDPTTGDSTADFYITYRIVNL